MFMVGGCFADFLTLGKVAILGVPSAMVGGGGRKAGEG